MASFECDRGFISKLLQTKDMLSVKDAQIRADFLSGESRLAYQYIYDVAISTGEVPSVRAFKRKFPNYELEEVYDPEQDDLVVGTEENLAFWCQELRNKKKQNTLADATEDIVQSLEDMNAEDAFLRMKKVIAYIESEVEETHDVDITKDTEDRKQKYLERKKNRGVVGIPTGISHLDYLLRGLAPQTLTTLIANTGVGKTWLEVYIGAQAMLHDYRVLQFVTEMSDEQMRDRYEAMLYSMCYGDFNYENFKRGMLDRKTEKKYFQFLDDDLPNMEPLQIITASGVMSVSAAVDKYKPDLVLIDGVYLMDDDQGADSDWLRVAHITRDLKKLAKRTKLPFFINSQADKNTSKRTGPELGSISYTQAIGQDCLPADTLVLTDSGYKRIQMLEGEVFKVFDGEKYKKAYCTNTGDKPVCTITYRGNEFRCSPEHKVFVYDEQVANFVWKKAKDIEPENDFLLEQNFLTEEGHSHVLLYKGGREGRNSNLVFPTTANSMLGLFLGIFIGDGSVKPLNKGQVTVSCGQDIEYANLCIRLVKDLFNLDGHIATVISTTSKREEYLATWYSVCLSDWLYKFTHDAKGCKDVKIDFVELNSDFRVGLLSGLLQSDGTCKSQAEFVTSIERNAKMFILLCKSLGICTRYDFEPNSHKGKHRVRLMTEDVVNIPLQFVGQRKAQFEELTQANYCGRLNKPQSFVKKFCRYLKDLLVVDSLDYKKVCVGCKSGQIGQSILNRYSNFPYKFMQVDDVVVTSTTESMWSIQVYDKDKRILTNGVVTHNSDNVLALFRDETMIADKEMGIKVLKQREGECGRVYMQWDFDHMKFGAIYSERESGDSTDQSFEDGEGTVKNTIDMGDD